MTDGRHREGSKQMVSGELIRLKTLVDDCSRMARIVQREYPRLDPSEQVELAEYIRKHAPRLDDVIGPAPASNQTPQS